MSFLFDIRSNENNKERIRNGKKAKKIISFSIMSEIESIYDEFVLS